MNIKKTVKKIAALGASAGMLGLTAGMAFAQAPDLQDYPDFVMSQGAFDGRIVVGAEAAAEDILGSIDIAASLQAASRTPVAGDGAAPGHTLEGDVKQIRASGDILEFGESMRSVVETISSQDLEMLRSGTVSTQRGNTGFTQVLRMGEGPGAHGSVVYEERNTQDGRELLPALFFRGGETVFEYELDFTSGLRSSLEGSAADQTAIDFEDEAIYMLGSYYTITQATTDGTGLRLTLLAGDVADTLAEGATRTYEIDGETYEVTVMVIGTSGDEPAVQFLVNGETTRSLREGRTEMVAGIELGVRDIIQTTAFRDQDASSIVSFWLGANQMVIDSQGTGDVADVELDRETLSSNAVETRLRYTFPGSSIRLNNIEFDVRAEADFAGDIWVAEGEGVRQFLRYPEAMINPDWDIVFEGLSQPTRSEIEFNPRGDEEYRLTFTNTRGDRFSVPYVYWNEAEDALFFGDDRDSFIFHEGVPVTRNDQFVLSFRDKERRGETYVLEWTSVNPSQNTLRFRHAATGQEIVATYDVNATGDPGVGAREESYVAWLIDELDLTSSPTVDQILDAGLGNDLRDDEGDALLGTPAGDILVAGQSYDFWLFNTSSSNSVNDWELVIDLNNDGRVVVGEARNIVVHGGGILSLGPDGEAEFSDDGDIAAKAYRNLNPDGASFSVEDDDVLPLNLTTLGAQMDGSDPVGIEWAISARSDRIDITTGSFDNVTGWFSGMQSESRSDLNTAYDQYGTFYELDDRSGANSLMIHYPREQVEAMVYVVGGSVQRAAAEVVSTGASQVNILPVGLAVLDTDITNPDATNHIVVGGPCANSIAATLLDDPVDCAEGFEPGMGMIRTFSTGNNVAVLVAGYSAQDTVQTSRVLARAATETVSGLSGDSAEVTIAGANDVSVRSAQ